eukprot:CAMPEP_0202071958 /NCGR_PEP_ID=MMETSP0964-20121228/2124_1 /ASSEMBLY_ACC=CAM_ASM_000500 /TAXON_ID=4773 /ORGANISM="Schizochytrium aggregatum, Strain ATCC28209" /LENGTH=494 /DNA_ID=CAMNT_0048638969 /DNA_START=21 /DNA_END=1505 /DNA_ORIENTATION=-
MASSESEVSDVATLKAQLANLEQCLKASNEEVDRLREEVVRLRSPGEQPCEAGKASNATTTAGAAAKPSPAPAKQNEGREAAGEHKLDDTAVAIKGSERAANKAEEDADDENENDNDERAGNQSRAAEPQGEKAGDAEPCAAEAPGSMPKPKSKQAGKSKTRKPMPLEAAAGSSGEKAPAGPASKSAAEAKSHEPQSLESPTATAAATAAAEAATDSATEDEDAGENQVSTPSLDALAGVSAPLKHLGKEEGEGTGSASKRQRKVYSDETKQAIISAYLKHKSRADLFLVAEALGMPKRTAEDLLYRYRRFNNEALHDRRLDPTHRMKSNQVKLDEEMRTFFVDWYSESPQTLREMKTKVNAEFLRRLCVDNGEKPPFNLQEAVKQLCAGDLDGVPLSAEVKHGFSKKRVRSVQTISNWITTLGLKKKKKKKSTSTLDAGALEAEVPMPSDKVAAMDEDESSPKLAPDSAPEALGTAADAPEHAPAATDESMAL